MDIQFYGANCVSVTYKGQRVVVDDNLADLGGKSVVRAEDVALYTFPRPHSRPAARLHLDGPGEYEVADISITGIPARAHLDEPGTLGATMFKLAAGDTSVLVTGHIFPSLNETQLEEIGMVDVLVVPVGGNGFTVDPAGALQLIKTIEPKLVVPVHYADPSLKFEVPQQSLEQALTELGMEPKETVPKLRLKSGELSEVTAVVVVNKS